MALPYKFKASTIIEEGRTTQVAVNEIKKWLATTNFPKLQDEFIVLLLLSCRNDLPSTQATLLAYFKVKNEGPEIFNNRDIDDETLKKAMTVITCCSIPVRMGDNSVVHFFKLNDTNYRNVDLTACMKLSIMLIDISQRYNPPNDVVVVIDMKGATLMHLTCINIGFIKKFIAFLQEAMPLRIKKIHILNTNYVFDKGLAIVKVFIKNELMAAVKAHPPTLNMEEFYRDWVPASCLPKEYGGELPSVEELQQKSIEQFRELKHFFDKEEELRAQYKLK